MNGLPVILRFDVRRDLDCPDSIVVQMTCLDVRKPLGPSERKRDDGRKRRLASMQRAERLLNDVARVASVREVTDPPLIQNEHGLLERHRPSTSLLRMTIQVDLPDELVARIDGVAEDRTTFIADAVRLALLQSRRVTDDHEVARINELAEEDLIEAAATGEGGHHHPTDAKQGDSGDHDQP